MAQPRLLAPPKTSTPSSGSKIINNFGSTSTTSASRSGGYRPPTNPRSKPIPPPAPPSPKLPCSVYPGIDGLKAKLPDIPYLCSVPWGGKWGNTNPFQCNRRHEDNRGTPFGEWEWDRLQYMSLVPGDADRELVRSEGVWEETIEKERLEREMARERERRRANEPSPPGALRSGSATPWGNAKPAEGRGSGGNSTTHGGDRKKVSFGDYLKKKKDSPGDTPVKRPNGDEKRKEVPQVKVNGVVTEKSNSSNQQRDTAQHNHESSRSDIAAGNEKADEKLAANGHKPQPAQAKPRVPKKEEGELADEPSLPSSIANILKAPIGREPTLRQPSVPRDISPPKAANKRPAEDNKKAEPIEKKPRVESKSEAGPTSAPKQPYAGTSRPQGHQRAASGGLFDRLAGGLRQNSKPSTSLPPKPMEADKSRDGDKRKDNDKSAPAKNGMPRLLSPLPHMGSTNGTSMTRGDSKNSRRGDKTPPRSSPMQKSESKDSNRGRDRSPAPTSHPMQKSGSRDSTRGDDRRRSRSPVKSTPMAKGNSRDSMRERSPKREERGRSRSPRRDRSPVPRSHPMAKSNSKDARRDPSPVKKDIPAAAPKPKPVFGFLKTGDKTTFTSTKTTPAPAKKELAKEEKKKETIPMPPLMSFDLPMVVQDDMKRRLDNGELAPEVAAAFTKVTGHKRNTSNISNITTSTNGSGKREREETPATETERPTKKTSTQALRERARKPDTPGVARKAVATKTKARPKAGPEKKVVTFRFDEDAEVAEKMALILKTKLERDHLLSDYQGRRGKEMVTRRIDAVKAAEKEEIAASKRPYPAEEDEEESDQSPVQRKRHPPTAQPSTPKDSGLGADTSQSLAPPSISKLKQASTPDKANTPGAAATNTPKQEQPVSPTATRAAASSSASHNLTDKQREEVKRLRAEYDRYISLGTSLKRQRDALIRPSPESQGAKVSEVDAKKANIIGVESLLAYLVGFEAMDRAYRIEGVRNRGQHWKSLFPYLDSFRLGLKSSADEKAKVVLDIVATLVGYSGATCLAGIHNSLLEKDGPPNSRDEMVAFIKEQTGNFKRREAMAEGYRRRCVEVAERWPEMIRQGTDLSWITAPGGQHGGVEEVKGRLSKVVKEFCAMSRVEWEGKLDF